MTKTPPPDPPPPLDEGRTRQQTRTALLDAAEELFCEHGIDAASLRAITSAAGANLAAVNYHFGNKEGLVQAVFDRRIGPVNQERLRRLTDLEQAAAPGPPSAEGVLRAFLEPVVRFGQDSSAEQMRFRRLMGRTFAEPGSQMRQRLKGHFQKLGERFLGALSRCFPHLPPNVLLWRFHFMLGSMVQVALHGSLIAEHSQGICDPTKGEEVSRRLVEFLLAGFAAPVGSDAGAASAPAEAEDADGSMPGPSIFAWEEGF